MSRWDNSTYEAPSAADLRPCGAQTTLHTGRIVRACFTLFKLTEEFPSCNRSDAMESRRDTAVEQEKVQPKYKPSQAKFQSGQTYLLLH